MVPLSLKITKGEPAFAHAVAHSLLMGLSKPFVNAQAESSTYPLTVTAFPVIGPAAKAAARSRKSKDDLSTLRIFITVPPEDFQSCASNYLGVHIGLVVNRPLTKPI